MTLPSAVAELLQATPTTLLVGGAWRDAEGGATFDVHDPATGEVIAAVADASAADGAAAMDAAAAAQDAWAATPTRERAEVLRRAFDLVTERAEELATLMTLEMGKPLAESRGEVTYGGEFLRWFSEEAAHVNGRYQTAPEGTLRILTTTRPVGPCLFITPWNFPLAMATRKIAPALAAGCTVVLKPAALTPLTALALGQILLDAGVPDGVVNIVPTSSARTVTGPLLQDRRLRKLSFTGSTEVGRALLKEAAGNVLRTSMELGGSAPFVVFADADLDAALAGARQAKLRNMGEACTAANRFLVHEDVAEEFSRRLAEDFAGLTVGPGLEEGTDLGPLVSEDQRDGVHRLVTAARDGGARVLTGGEPVDGPGYFYRPTVLTGVAPDSPVMVNEIFGPVAPVTTFRDEDEAVRLANDSDVGLAAYVYTADLSRVLRLSERLEVGMVGVNTGLISNAAAPFGGVKHSGLGREGGVEGIEEYLETVYVALPV
ncbi:NAD-dependent succinate-semialdehyde dehydrogenase [Oceanitalea stevensii]|uniref:NAD-dependent succinate-semialdehyde dehydrogenase n=1 Tax=Oceanitalea stevensii TaxID=2763072 RepID=A0ABR8YZQ0_9MICO|nr:NAD-dependent succinate-semialdehyde dehydrogenase [Oceanitalea stevensii]MBD8061556.1 NAD-dependent succinate-semialdehyde dehydrogenase [Oceanitalea stevensii]